MRILLCLTLLFSSMLSLQASRHIILCGGPALRGWENLRVSHDQHDRWWANFVRASTIRMTELQRAYGSTAQITWIVYRPSYVARSREEGKPLIQNIEELAHKYHAKLIWVHSGDGAIAAINNHPRRSVVTFDFFGHSNRHCFLLDYSSSIMGVSQAWLHEKDLSRIHRSIFSPNIQSQSWGCHTGESMSATWQKTLGHVLLGACGKTNYEPVSSGKMPSVSGRWTR